ncbi:MAG: GNAT family N-acetyltransferase [Planctomycetes bacterium]|nr:GNAT family N-acetyltransferase [Planctomycetota bacterium]
MTDDVPGPRPIEETCGVYRLHERHLPALQQLAADPAIAATTRVPHPYPPDGAATFYALTLREREAGTAHVFAIEDDGRFVGLVGFHQIHDGTGELGYWVARGEQGRGVGRHAVRAAVRVAFDYLRLDGLWAEVLADNVASIRILEGLGFHRIGERAHDVERWPADVPLLRYELARDVGPVGG